MVKNNNPGPDNADISFDETDFIDIDNSDYQGIFDNDSVEVKSVISGMKMFNDIPLDISLEVASTEITLGELSTAKVGDVIALDKAVSEPLDVKVNGVLFARAEVVMVDGKYGLKFVNDKLSKNTKNE